MRGKITFPIWDCDGAKEALQNLRVLRAADSDGNHQVASLETKVTELYTHFEVNLEGVLRSELGASIYEAVLKEACEAYDAPTGRDAQKNPEIMKHALSLAKAQGAVSKTLEDIVRAIWRTLKNVDLP